jgi:pimeloyl-ACP methyl ester carboxylesterase
MTALLVALILVSSQDAGTVTFTEREGGTYPGTVQGREKVEIDLTPLPKGVTIHRAVFRPGRDESEAFAARDRGVRVTFAGGDQPLPLLPPRYTAFDVTFAVRAALEKGSLAFVMADFPGYRPISNRLDVTCTAMPKGKIPRVTGLAATHRAGQTILSWTEPDPVIRGDTTFGLWNLWQQKNEEAFRKVRYRVYRSEEPFSSKTIGRAEFVDEVGPLTGWNPEFYGIAPKDDADVPRFVIEEGKPPVAPGTGIYAHNPRKAGKFYYAVSVAVNGEEDLSVFDAFNSTARAVVETVGAGEPVLQRVVAPKSFSYVDGPTLHYYVRWESPPTSNLPSRPVDYLVAIPPKKVEPAPVGLHLHCWGGNLEGGYGWWYDSAQGAILISTNQIPYDWWTGYHENSGTWKSWKEGVVRPYSQDRVMAFLDWAGTKWSLDRSRVFTAGSSMGGSGSPNLALRHAGQVAWAVSWVGVHSPSRSPQFKGSYERVYGSLPWQLPYADGKASAFDYFDDVHYLRDHPELEAPLLCFSNGKNDAAIGWPQARDLWKALQEARQPHVFVWGQGGHGQRAILPGPNPNERELGVDVRLDRSLPAFTRGSLDGNPGSGDPKDGDPEGQSNLHLSWDPAAADEAEAWEMVVRLNARAPRGECTVDVTPRRCQKFRPAPGSRVGWRNVSVADGGVVQSGEVKADEQGRVTIPQAAVTRGGNRLTVQVTK